jgi:ketosteroid isomerase-like protein
MLERFRGLYARSNDRGPEALAEMFDEEVVIVQDPDLPGTQGTFRGHEGVLALDAEIAESYSDLVWYPRAVEGLGDSRYLILLDAKGVGVGSGVPVEAQIAHISTLAADGRILRVETYVTWDRGREAAGLA